MWEALVTHDNRGKAQLGTWVYTKVVWAIKRMTTDRRTTRMDGALDQALSLEHAYHIASPVDAPDELVDEKRTLTRVLERIDQLPSKYQEVLRTFLQTGRQATNGLYSRSQESRVFRRAIAALRELVADDVA